VILFIVFAISIDFPWLFLILEIINFDDLKMIFYIQFLYYVISVLFLFYLLDYIESLLWFNLFRIEN